MGRYAVGNTNALLQYLNAGGVKLTYTGGQADYTLPHGMIDYGSQADNGASAALGYNFIATVQHNGVQNPTFTGRYLPEGNSIRYQGIEYRYGDTFLLTPEGDYKITRLSKIVTDVDGSAVYGEAGGGYSLSNDASPVGLQLYRSGAGTMYKTDADGNKTNLAAAYKYITGGVDTVDEVLQTYGDGSFIATTTFDSSAAGINASAPLPYMLQSGDSGSPAWVWNEGTERYEYIATCQGVGEEMKMSLHVAACDWTVEQMASFDKKVQMGDADEVIFLSAVDVVGESVQDATARAFSTLYSGTVTNASGAVLTHYNGVQSGTHTWKALNDLKDTDNWYTYGAGYLNATASIQSGYSLTYADLFYNDNLVISAHSAVTREVVLKDTVDLGIGYVQFKPGREGAAANFVLRSEGEESNLLNAAGFIVEKGASVTLELTNPTEYMREWRKVGEGSLCIKGSGDNGIFLNVGGRGVTSLEREGGYAAYNVLANNGATVVIRDINQIKRDFTFGNRGGVLDMNGNSMVWNNDHDAEAEGFTIHALDEQAVIANTRGAASLTWKQGDSQTWLGSFRDGEAGSLTFIYDGGAGAQLTMHSIHTDLRHADSGMEVRSGRVVLSGTNTVHAVGSATGTSVARYSHEDDWHYADARMNVNVAANATFELGSHARLQGDVTVESGGSYVMREGVAHRMEYIEGGYAREDTNAIRDYFGHKGDVSLAAGASMKVQFSAGTDSTLEYNGHISGAGDVSVDAQEGVLKLGGTNTFSGTKEVLSGGVHATSNAALGDTSTHKWVIGGRAWLASDGFTTAEQIAAAVDTSSTGVLALSRNIGDELKLGNLIVGAAEGCTVHYGTAEAALGATNGRWTLGGGGGTLVVDFLLTGNNELVLGNQYARGSVHLSNSGNDFTGNITFAGAVTLSYDAGALGGSTVNLQHGNRMVLLPDSISRVSAGSEGVLLLDAMGNQGVDLRSHQQVSLGAASSMTYSGPIALAEGADYRFGGMTGDFTVATALEGGHDMQIDAQGYSGGSIAFTNAQAFNGGVSISGSGGEATLTFKGEDAMVNASSFTVGVGGAIDLAGTSQSLQGVTLQEGGLITDSSVAQSGRLTINGESSLQGTLAVARVEKVGSGDLLLGGDNSYQRLEVSGGRVLLDSSTATSETGTIILANGGTLDMNGQTARGSIIVMDGGAITTPGTQAVDITVEGKGSLTTSNGGTLTGLLTLCEGAALEVAANAFTVEQLAGTGTLQLSSSRTAATVFTVNGDQSAFEGTLAVRGPGIGVGKVGAGLKLATWQSAGKGILSVDAASFYLGAANAAETAVQARLHVGSGGAVMNGSSGKAYYFTSLSGSGLLASCLGKSNTGVAAAAHFLGDLRGFTGQFGSTLNNTGAAFSFTFGGEGVDYHQVTGSSAAGAIALFGSGQVAQLQSETGRAQVSYTFCYGDDVILNAKATGRSHVTQAGAGTLVLNQQNSSTGTLTINAGGRVELAESGTWAGALAGAGTLRNSNTQAEVVFSGADSFSGSLELVRGSSLSFGEKGFYSLDSGQHLEVFGSAVGSAVFSVDSLALNGGELIFHADSLSGDGTPALALGNAYLSCSTGQQALSLTGTASLSAGDYLLASGDWSALKAENVVLSGIGDYYSASLSTGTDGLRLGLTLNDGVISWAGTESSNSWNSTAFGTAATPAGVPDTALFTDTAQSREVRMTGEMKAGTLVFDTALGYELTVEGSGSLEAANLRVGGGGAVALGSGITITTSTVIDADSSLVVSEFGLLKGRVSGEGTLCVDAREASGRLDANLSGLSTLQLRSGRYEAIAGMGVSSIVVENGQFFANKSTHESLISLSGSGWENPGGEYAAAALRAEEAMFKGGIQLAGNATMAVTGGTSTLSGALDTQGYTLSLQGGGTLLLNTSAVSGALSVQGGTTLAVQQDFNEGSTRIHMEDGARLQMLRQGQGTLMLQGLTLTTEGKTTIGGSLASGSAVISGSISGTGELELTTAGNEWTLKSTLSDAEGGALALRTNTRVELDAENSFSGGTTVAGGTLIAANSKALGGGAVRMEGGTLSLKTDVAIASLSGTGGAVAMGEQELSLGKGTAEGSQATYAGSISGTGVLVKQGKGTQGFCGAVTVAEARVEEGRLALSGSGTLNIGSALSVSALQPLARSRAGAVAEGTLENVTLTETSMTATVPANEGLVFKATVEVAAPAFALTLLQLQESCVTVSTANATLRLEGVQVDAASTLGATADGVALALSDVKLTLGQITETMLTSGSAYGSEFTGSMVATLRISTFSNVSLSGNIALDASGLQLPQGTYSYVAVDFGEGVDVANLTATANFRAEEFVGLHGDDSSVLLFAVPGQAVPEPASSALALLGLSGLALRRRRK